MKIASLDNKLKINISFIRLIKNTLIFIALSRIKNYFVGMFFIKKILNINNLKEKLLSNFIIKLIKIKSWGESRK